MRVNIKGRGIVPRVGKLAPAYNQDLQKNDIEFLLNFNQFKVYETKTGLLITRDTVDEMFAKSQKPVAPKKPTVIEKPAPVPTPAPTPVKVEEPAVEVKEEVAPVVEPTVTEEEVAQSFIEDVAAVEEQLPEKEELEFPVENPDTESFEPAANDEEVADVVESDEDVAADETDAVVEDETPQQSYPSKKKKKNRS